MKIKSKVPPTRLIEKFPKLHYYTKKFTQNCFAILASEQKRGLIDSNKVINVCFCSYIEKLEYLNREEKSMKNKFIFLIIIFCLILIFLLIFFKTYKNEENGNNNTNIVE